MLMEARFYGELSELVQQHVIALLPKVNEARSGSLLTALAFAYDDQEYLGIYAQTAEMWEKRKVAHSWSFDIPLEANVSVEYRLTHLFDKHTTIEILDGIRRGEYRADMLVHQLCNKSRRLDKFFPREFGQDVAPFEDMAFRYRVSEFQLIPCSLSTRLRTLFDEYWDRYGDVFDFQHDNTRIRENEYYLCHVRPADLQIEQSLRDAVTGARQEILGLATVENFIAFLSFSDSDFFESDIVLKRVRS